MKILVTGASGQLGSDVMLALRQRGHEAIGFGSRELDITNRSDVLAKIEALIPDAIIHIMVP